MDDLLIAKLVSSAIFAPNYATSNEAYFTVSFFHYISQKEVDS